MINSMPTQNYFINKNGKIRYVVQYLHEYIKRENHTVHIVVSAPIGDRTPKFIGNDDCQGYLLEEQNCNDFYYSLSDAQIAILIYERFNKDV